MIMGKSATGKDRIYRSVIEEMKSVLEPLVIYTTRPKREGETDGVEYHFTDEEHLCEMREAGRVMEERVYSTVHGNWYYFTADDGKTDLENRNYLIIGTLEAYVAMRRFYGSEKVYPIYLEISDAARIRRAVEREAMQKKPAFSEVCRRYLADEEDFSEENIKEAGIVRRFSNEGAPEECVREVIAAIETAIEKDLDGRKPVRRT